MQVGPFFFSIQLNFDFLKTKPCILLHFLNAHLILCIIDAGFKLHNIFGMYYLKYLGIEHKKSLIVICTYLHCVFNSKMI